MELFMYQQQKGFTYNKDKQSWHESGHHNKLKQSNTIYPAESTQTKQNDGKVHRHYTASCHARYKYQERPSEKNTHYAGFIVNVTARSTNIICSTLSSCYIHTDLYLHNILSIKLMSSNGLGSTIMNISWKQERKEAAFSRKTLMFLFFRCYFHEIERVTPSIALGICEYHQSHF